MRVSVCIPTYNQAAYIEEAIRSVFNQTLLPHEVIVSNDNSTDGTAVLLTKLSEEFNLLKVVSQPANLGIVKNTNTCLRMANGDLIVRLDSDDRLLPEYIQRLASLMVKYADAGYAHCAVNEINAVGHKLKTRILNRKAGFKDADTALKESVHGYKVAANIIMFRKDVLEKVNYIPENVRFGEDYYLSVSIASAGYGNVYDEQALACYRVWSDTDNVRKKRKLNEINGLRIIFEEAIIPRFQRKGWDLRPTDKARANFAKRQADCLSWNLFSKEELSALESALLKLSSAKAVKRYIKLYKSPFAQFVTMYHRVKGLFISHVKALIQ